MAKLTGFDDNQMFQSSVLAEGNAIEGDHKGYKNSVLEAKLDELLETGLNARNFMTIDNSLVAAPGMIKKIHRYQYAGEVENVKLGQGNTKFGQVKITSEAYEVEVAQQKFAYRDEEFMQDPMIVDAGLNGMSKTMINDMNAKFFAELAKGTLEHELKDGENLNYDAVVDAIEKLSVQDNVIGGINVEDESGLIILVGADMRADLRKDDDFVRANQGAILFSGQIGSVCGIPVVHSRMVPEKTAYVFTKEAVTLFVKKDSEIEQSRKADTRTNEVYARKVNLCALTDDTKVIRIVKKDA
jgi:hypothetical protein